MQLFYLLMITVTVHLSPRFVLARDDDDDDDGDDDCNFMRSLIAKPEMKQLVLPVTRNQYPRDYCMYWKISVPLSEAVEVHIPAISSTEHFLCKKGYLKLLDDDSDLARDYNNWSPNTKCVTQGSDLKIYFRPPYCSSDITLNYQSVAKLIFPDEAAKVRAEKDDSRDDDDDDDTEEDTSTSTGSIVGAVVGSVLAVLLVVLACFVIFWYLRRTRGRNSQSVDERVTVHFWSKSRGYTGATEMKPTTSSDDPEYYGSQAAASPEKSRDAAPDLAPYNGPNQSTFMPLSPPVPPPYNEAYPQEAFHHSVDLPPSYVDATKTK